MQPTTEDAKAGDLPAEEKQVNAKTFKQQRKKRETRAAAADEPEANKNKVDETNVAEAKPDPKSKARSAKREAMKKKVEKRSTFEEKLAELAKRSEEDASEQRKKDVEEVRRKAQRKAKAQRIPTEYPLQEQATVAAVTFPGPSDKVKKDKKDNNDKKDKNKPMPIDCESLNCALVPKKDKLKKCKMGIGNTVHDVVAAAKAQAAEADSAQADAKAPNGQDKKGKTAKKKEEQKAGDAEFDVLLAAEKIAQQKAKGAGAGFKRRGFGGFYSWSDDDSWSEDDEVRHVCRRCGTCYVGSIRQEFCDIRCVQALCKEKTLTLTVHFAEDVRPDGSVEVICTNIAGDEIVQVHADVARPVTNLYTTIAVHLPDEDHLGEYALHLVLPDGRLLRRGSQKLCVALSSSSIAACSCGKPVGIDEFCGPLCREKALEEMHRAFYTKKRMRARKSRGET